MSCPTVYEILKTQCIGNSLPIINENFLSLRDASCDNDTRIMSADLQITNLSTIIDHLSSLIIPGSAKAWCKFSGIKDTNNVASNFFTDRYLFSGFNVASVYKKAAGDYRIQFINDLPSNNYGLIGTSSEKKNSNNDYTWFQPYNLTSNYAEVKIQSSSLTNNTVDPDFVSIVVY
jgi:hypothetical protein